MRRCWLLVLTVALAACEPPLPATGQCSDDTDCQATERCDLTRGQCVALDAGSTGDAGRSDGTTVDLGTMDGAPVDQGLVDARAPDASPADHGGVDASASDQGPDVDGAQHTDAAGSTDAAPGADAASHPDAHSPDTRPAFYASAGADRQVVRNTRVYLSAADSVLPQGAAITYAWTLEVAPAGTTAILIDTDQLEASFVAGDAHGHYEVELVVSVDGDALPADRVSVDVLNTEPVASAGSDQGVYQGHGIALDGSASYDDDGDDLSFGWVVLVGQGSLDDASSATPTFTPAAGFVGTATLRLIVDDGHGGQDSDDVDVIVSDNLPPQIGALSDLSVPHACAGTPLRCGATAALAASVTEPEGESYTLLWELLSCPTGAAVAGACPDQGQTPGAVPGFTAATAATTDLVLDEAPGVLIAGVYTLRLTATDLGGRAATASLHVTVENRAPTGQGGSASAPHTYAGGTYTCQVEFSYTLDDADSDPLEVLYTVSPQAGAVTPGLPGSAIFRLQSATPAAALLAPYTITISASDGQGGSVQLTQQVRCTNAAPSVGAIVDSTPAGHFYRATGSVYGSTLALSASVDDVEADPVTCTWSVPAPVALVSYGTMPTVLSPITALPGTAALGREITSSGGAQVIADHGLVLSCSDGFAQTTADVTVPVTNRYPSPNAGADMSVHHSYSATGNPYRASADLGTRGAGNASASDPDGDPLSFGWQQISSMTGNNPQVAGNNSLTPSFSWSGDTRVVATHTLRLGVTDGPGATALDYMDVSVGNRAPTVNAGADHSANHAYVSAATRYDATFDLNARGTKATSSDPDGDPLTYAWVATSTPSGVTYLYSNQAAPNPVITAQGNTSVVGNHDFRLTATDPFAASANDTVRVTGLNRAPVESVAATLSPAPLVVSQNCWQESVSFPATPGFCVAQTQSPAPSSGFTATYADPDGDPITVVITPTINNGNGVGISGHSQSGSSITISSPSGAALAISAAISLAPRSFDDPCTAFNVSGYFVGYVGKNPGPTQVGVGAVINDPFTNSNFGTWTSLTASNKVNCP